MLIPIHQIIFYVFSAIIIASSLMVVISRNPVKAALFLVLTFVASSILWMTLQAEFLSLALIFVYVGAVMTLFLFVVMMLNEDVAAMRDGFVRYLPFGVIVMALLIGLLIYVVGPAHMHDAGMTLQPESANYSNVSAMGMLLFTRYLYELEIAALILLVAMIAAISLAFFGRKKGTRTQNINQQLQANKANRLRVVSMEADKK